MCPTGNTTSKATQTEFAGFQQEDCCYVTKTVTVTKALTVNEMLGFARQHGFVCVLVEQLRQEVRLSIVTRLRNRTTNDCYQAPGFFLRGFPRSAAKQIWGFFEKPIKSAGKRVLTWTVDRPEMVGRMLLDLEGCPRDFHSCGSSRLLPGGRTIATVIPSLEVSHVTTQKGREVLYLSMNYVLYQDLGELHLPKNAAKEQIGLQPSELRRVMKVLLQDMTGMEELGYPLSDAFRQMVSAQHAPMDATAHPPTAFPPPSPTPQLQELAEAFLEGESS